MLVIDDEPGVRESLREIFKRDFEVLEAEDGAAALALRRLAPRRRGDARRAACPASAGLDVLPKLLALDHSIAVDPR